MNYYQENQAAFLEGLKTWLRIPSISTLTEHKPDIRRAAEFALNELRAAGLTGELIEGEGNPLVYAEWLGAPGKPTLLMYGHYDVQPPDPQTNGNRRRLSRKFAGTIFSGAGPPTIRARLIS